ncbi:MAG TPA: helix-turn-helix domain-containing protein [Terriglobales bacterium]|nr:helix-turn-helix domain-containing protein [Terriglobales bacterium]
MAKPRIALNPKHSERLCWGVREVVRSYSFRELKGTFYIRHRIELQRFKNMQRKSFDRDAARRRVILDAARDCILKFGYAKSSLEDIAKQAAVSRPLIYRKFKSKEEIFGAVLEDLFETQYRAAEHALAKPGSRREKLMSVYEALLFDPWRELIVDAPMGTEFYGACRRVTPEIYERRRKIQLKYTQVVLGTKEVSEVFMLAVDGLTHDLPATKVLRMRLEVLIDRFVRD